MGVVCCLLSVVWCSLFFLCIVCCVLRVVWRASVCVVCWLLSVGRGVMLVVCLRVRRRLLRFGCCFCLTSIVCCLLLYVACCWLVVVVCC